MQRVTVASDHIQRHTHTHTVGLLWVRDRPVADTSTWQHATFTRHMPVAEFEPTFPLSERQQTYSFDSAATGNSIQRMVKSILILISEITLFSFFRTPVLFTLTDSNTHLDVGLLYLSSLIRHFQTQKTCLLLKLGKNLVQCNIPIYFVVTTVSYLTSPSPSNKSPS